MAEKESGADGDAIAMLYMAFAVVGVISQLREKNLIDTPRLAEALRLVKEGLSEQHEAGVKAGKPIMDLIDLAVSGPRNG